jgi:hypothetical protein
MNAPRLIKAQQTRQKILDVLNKHGKLSNAQICSLIGFERFNNIHWPLSWMELNGEIESLDGRPRLYIALEKNTMPADQVQKQKVSLSKFKPPEPILAPNQRIIKLLDKPARSNHAQQTHIRSLGYSGMYAQF